MNMWLVDACRMIWKNSKLTIQMLRLEPKNLFSLKMRNTWKKSNKPNINHVLHDNSLLFPSWLELKASQKNPQILVTVCTQRNCLQAARWNIWKARREWQKYLECGRNWRMKRGNYIMKKHNRWLFLTTFLWWLAYSSKTWMSEAIYLVNIW